MKFTFATAVLLVLPGITAFAYAQPGRGQGEHGPASGPAQQQARPMQQQHKPMQQQTRPMQQQARPMQQQRQVLPAPRQQTQNSVPAHQRAHPTGPAQQGGFTASRGGARQSPPATHVRGEGEHGRISNAHYASRFGREHSFHVNHRDYDQRRFQYGGYAFGFVDPWPVDWGYSDDVYVVYTDDGYYMYNRFHPGLRIAINIL